MNPLRKAGLALVLLFVSTLTFLISYRADAQTRYFVVDLGLVPGGNYCQAECTNAVGQVVGNNGAHAFLWDDIHGMQDLGTLPGGSYSNGQSINVAGQVVGGSDETGTGLYGHAFLWDSVHGMQDIGVLPGCNESGANSINTNSQVVGTSHTTVGYNAHAFLWDSSHGMQDIGVLQGDTTSVANSINSVGQVIGTSFPGGSDYLSHAFLWDSVHGMQDLGTLLGGDTSSADAINAVGQVTGYSDSPTLQAEAIVWDSVHGMQGLGVLPGGSFSEGLSINVNGQVVGYSDTTNGDHAILWDSVHGMQDLNSDTLTDPVSRVGWVLSDAKGIDDKGWICGWGTFNGIAHAFVLLPANIAQIYTTSMTFQSTGQSIWGLGQSSFDFNYFLGPQWNTGTKNIGGYFDPCTPEIDLFFFTIPSICLGNFGASAQLGTQGRAGLQLTAHADTGTANINYPVSVKLQFPDRTSILAGDLFPLTSSYAVDSAATLSTTSPTASASLTAVLEAQNTAHVNAQAFGLTLLDTDLLPQSFLSINDDRKIFDTGELLGNNQSADFYLPSPATPLLQGTVKIPQLNVAAGPDPNNPNSPIKASAEDTFFSLEGHVTDWISEAWGIPLSSEGDFLGGDIHYDYNLLDLRPTVNLRLHQDLAFAATPHVHLDVSDGQGNAESVVWQDVSGTAHTGTAIDFTAGDTIHITMPNPPSLTFAPTFTLPNSFSNSTSLIINPEMTFVPFELAVNASFSGWDLASFDFVPFQWSGGGNLTPIPLVSKSFALNNFAAQTMAPITVSGRDHPAPTLTDISPNVGLMYIINDNLVESAALTAFQDAVSGATTVTLSGENLQPSGMHVYFSYYGAKLDLPVTYLATTAAIQVQLPNKVLLLPGVGRFTVTAPNTASGNAPSNSLDFTVDYPVPDLVKAGPSMWASDPRFLDATLSVVGDNFLDIPDYYQYNPDSDPQTGIHPHRLLQYFWSVSNFTPDMPQLFPNFNFTAVAPLPTVDWNGQQLPLFVEPDPTGLAPSLLPNALFATSTVATVTIQNPGPGGGICPIPVIILIGAPHPQITTLMPTSAQPGDPDLRLVVKGQSDFPDKYYDPTDPNQPVAHGFEVGSTVNWNGIPLATTFVSATELHADVPAGDLATGAVNQITVANPVVNKDGTTDIYTSAQAAFTVANPVPALASVYPSLLIAANPGTQTGQDAPANNLTLKGTGFVPTSAVTWNGASLTTTYKSATVLDAAVPATLVALAGIVTIQVVNPAPGGGSSANAAMKTRRGQALVPMAGPTPVTVTIQNAMPGVDAFHLKISQISPSPIPPSSGDTTIQVQGTGFFSGSVVNWNGAPLPTTFQSWHALQAIVPAASLTQSGSVTVTNPNSGVLTTPDGGTSNALTVSIATPPVAISLSLSPLSVVGGNNVTGVVTINAAAPAGGASISMSSSSSSAMVPAVTVATGATSATFTIMTDPVTTATPVTITAGSSSAAITAHLTLYTVLPISTVHVLWTNTNGQASIWNTADPNPAATCLVVGPFDGWTAVALADGSNGQTRLLWDNTDGRISVWNLSDPNPAGSSLLFGPFPGWTGVGLADGPNGQVRLLWDSTSGQTSVWNLSDPNPAGDSLLYGPFGGWTAKRISVGPDNAAHLLWDSAAGQTSVWNLSDADPAASCVVSGPFGGWSGVGLAVGSDSAVHLLWDSTGGPMSLWNLSDAQPDATCLVYGPYSGWTAVDVSATP